MTKLIGIFLLFFSLNSFAATQKIEVLGMVCAYCAQGIEKSLKSLSEVKDVYINLEKFFVLVESKNDLGIDEKKVNVNGGAIAMGHPLGATGAMLLGTALDELERTGKSTALSTLCVASGMGASTIIEKV